MQSKLKAQIKLFLLHSCCERQITLWLQRQHRNTSILIRKAGTDILVCNISFNWYRPIREVSWIHFIIELRVRHDLLLRVDNLTMTFYKPMVANGCRIMWLTVNFCQEQKTHNHFCSQQIISIIKIISEHPWLSPIRLKRYGSGIFLPRSWEMRKAG